MPRASCEVCANITKKFEDECLRNTLGPFREQLGLKTRRKKNRGKPLEMIIKRPDGGIDKIVDTAANLPKYCLSFKWEPPGLVRLGSSKSQLNFDGGEIVLYALKGELESFIPKGHGVRLGGFKMLDYARMLAKIAHTYAYAKFGPDTFEHALPDLILGKNEYAPYLVGGDPRGTPPAQPGVIHDIDAMRITDSASGISYLGIFIRLFVFCGAPRYLVIVGKQLKEFNLPKPDR